MDLERLLEDVSYTCGATLDELDLPENLKSVCVMLSAMTQLKSYIIRQDLNQSAFIVVDQLIVVIIAIPIYILSVLNVVIHVVILKGPRERSENIFFKLIMNNDNFQLYFIIIVRYYL